MTIDWKTKKVIETQKVFKNAQKLRIFSLKMHKSARILKIPQNLSK